MKKIGIAAVTYKDNFGSALQTYATQYTQGAEIKKNKENK